MVPTTVEQLLSNESESAVEEMLADQDNVFLVDWREEDDAIVGYCEDILKTGDLTAELVETDADPGFEIYISHRGKRVKVPLVVGPEDRHITLYTLNELLKPAFEIRVCVDSNGSDTLAFLPLAAADWSGPRSSLWRRRGEALSESRGAPEPVYRSLVGGGPAA